MERQLEQPIGRSVPQVNGYEGRIGQVEIGRVTGRAEAGPAVQGKFAGGQGFDQLARGLMAVSNAREREVAQKQTLDAMAETQSFKDRERVMLENMVQMKGSAGFDAPAYVDAFYQKEGQALTGKARGDFQKMYYERFLASERERGMNAAYNHRGREMDAYEASVVSGQMVELFNELDQNPAGWNELEARGLETIRLASIGLDTTAKEQDFRRQLALRGVESAAARGDMDTAWSIINSMDGALNAKEQVDLKQSFNKATSEARVSAGIQAGLQRGQVGKSYEFSNEVIDDVATGRLNPEEGQKILQGVRAIEETSRQQRKSQQEAAEEEAKEQWLHRGLTSAEDIEAFRNDDRLPSDYRQRRIKETTSTRAPSLDSAMGRGIDQKIKMAIDSGQIQPADLTALFDLVASLDPDVRYVSSAAMKGYEGRLNKMGKADGFENPKRNYFNEAAQVLAQKDSNYRGQENALKLYELKNAVYQELEREGKSVFSPEAGQALLDAANKKVVTKSGRFFDDTERWFKLPADQRPSLYERAPSDGGVGGVLGGSMAAAGALAQAALKMTEAGESHWLTDYSENDPAIAFARLAEDQATAQGLPRTPFSREWAAQSILEHRPAREITPSFARNWAGQGRVSLSNLGRVHDYNGLIERYATGYGLDPDLIAAMMYTESHGDRFAISSAGASGLMQFTPATAERFGITDRTDPAQSIRGACQYMRWLLDRYDGDVARAVGAYNAGEGNIDKGWIPKETAAYVPKVLGLWRSPRADRFGSLMGRPAGASAQMPGSMQDKRNLPQRPVRADGTASPLGNMLVTSKFGLRNTGIKGASTNHEGIDLRAPMGTPVGAWADGVVETAAYKGKNGNYVVIDHGKGRKSYYLHLSGFEAKPGDKVKAGQIIGKSGNSGDFNKPLAPHLDFRISVNNTYVDPAKYLTGLKYKEGV